MSADHRVIRFNEKTQMQTEWVSAGLFVLERAAVEHYLPVDRDLMLEEEPIRRLADDGELMAYQHDGYWQPVDTWKELHDVRAQLSYPRFHGAGAIWCRLAPGCSLSSLPDRCVSVSERSRTRRG
jgi:NDP-sugar pyrophosphorylase family protein